MPIMDVFNSDAFTAVSLTAAVDKFGYVPGYLNALPGLVQPAPIRTTEVWIEARANAPALIQTSPRGAPPAQKSGDKRDARPFQTTRIAVASTINASELQSIRAFGQEQALKDLQQEVARRQFKMRQDFELTKEHMLLGCVQGLVVDADGSTVINDWASAFSQAIPAEVPFSLTTAAVGNIRTLANGIRRTMVRNLQGMGGAAVQIHALCGDTFWDEFITSTEVRTTYQAVNAMQLQNAVGSAWESYSFANITWHNYRGTDDNSTVAVATDKVKFFPTNAGIFQRADAPAERFEFVNTLGQETYSWIVPDRDRDAWASIEMYSYPLYVCTMPSALASGRAGA